MVKIISFLISVLFLIPSVSLAAYQETNEKAASLLKEAWGLERQMHIDAKSLDKALVVLEEARKLAPKNPEAFWRTGEVLFKIASVTEGKDKKNELYDSALVYAKQSLELEPDSVGGLYWTGCINAKSAQLAGVFSALGKVKEAKKYLSKTIETAPEHRFSTLSMTILALINASTPWPMKDMDKAMEYAKKAVEREPNLTLATLNLAKIYIKEKEYEKAREWLNKCLSTENPKYIWDSQLKDWPEAKKILKEIEGK